MKKISIVILAFFMISGGFLSCGKMKGKLQGLNPKYVTEQWLISFQKQDWKTNFEYTHSDMMKLIKSQKLTSSQKKLSDEELFSLEMSTAMKNNPGKKLKTYEVKAIPEYKKGEKEVWVTVVLNGQEKKMAVRLDGVSLKVDPTKIK